MMAVALATAQTANETFETQEEVIPETREGIRNGKSNETF